ncbi:hypothetical protein AGMMS4952_17890 [Spirochaetia bacterium]|nr:hypothetical protein AGMMS4952_17890 [Spirochaetia bacterium]
MTDPPSQGTLLSVEIQKNAFILTDNAVSTQDLAARLAAEMRGVTVRVLTASNFTGRDILPADYCFFGCEQPHPPEFAYLEELLQHINLVGRPCGVFSPDSAEALRYLANLTGPSELAMSPEPLLGRMSASPDLKQWVAGILKQK